MAWRGGLGIALGAAACAAVPLLAHFAVTGQPAAPLRALLTALPLLAIACCAAARPERRAFWLAVLAATGAAILVTGRDGSGLVAAYGVPHGAAYGFLAVLFGRTLAAGREPLVTGIARRIHGSLEPEIVAYTRRVTAAWCVFFVAQLAGSLALFAFAPLEAWSLFVNVLNIPLVLLMFAVEYGYRVSRYPDHPRASLASTVRAFARSG